MKKYLSDILFELRENRGLTLRELAAISGISHASISRIETGVSEPRPETLIALAEALGVEADILLDAPVKGSNTVDIEDILKDYGVDVLLGGKKMTVRDRRHVLELIQLAKKMSEEE